MYDYQYVMDSNVITISISSIIKEKSDDGDKYVLSPVVILCSCILNNQKTNTGWK